MAEEQVVQDVATPEQIAAPDTQVVEAAQPPPQAEPQPTAFSVRDYLKENNFGDVAQQFQDDRAAVHHLVTGYRQAEQARQQAEQFAVYGQQVVPHWSAFQDYLRQRQQAEQQQQKQQAATSQEPWWKPYWQAPDYDPSWEKLIRRDEQGNLTAAPGAPPDVVAKYANYAQYRQQQADRLMANPFAYIEEPVKTLARQMAEQVVQEKMSSYQEQTYAKEFTDKNSDWLYTVAPDGRKVLSQYGESFKTYAQQAQDMGVVDVRKQQEYATAMLQRDYYYGQANGQQQQATVQQQGQQAKEQFLKNGAGAKRLPPASGSSAVGAGAQNNNLSLAQRLRQNFKAGGVTDDLI